MVKKIVFLMAISMICTQVMAAPFTVKMGVGPGGHPYIVNPQGDAAQPGWMTTPFDTFCVETDRNFSNGGTYSATIDNQVFYGTPGTPDNTPPNGDYLTDAVKQIYSAYLNGEIADAAAAQKAVWHNRGYTNAARAAADAALQATYMDSNKNAGWTSVMVLNLWNVDHAYEVRHDIQSQLVRVPVPGAFILGTMGLGFASWRMKRRKRA